MNTSTLPALWPCVVIVIVKVKVMVRAMVIVVVPVVVVGWRVEHEVCVFEVITMDQRQTHPGLRTHVGPLAERLSVLPYPITINSVSPTYLWQR
jgi:hypothetical protein